MGRNVGRDEPGRGEQLYCFHGPTQRAKFGVDVGPDGVETCRRCQRPVAESLARVAASREVPDLMLSTVGDVPGYRLAAYRGLVTVIAADPGRAPDQRPGSSWHNAMDDIRRLAALTGANAVVGLQMQSCSAGTGESSVLLMGTAVVVEPLLPPPPPVAR